LHVRQRWALRTPLGKGTKNIDAALAHFCIRNRLAHEVRNDGALVLSSEDFIELSFYVIGKRPPKAALTG